MAAPAMAAPAMAAPPMAAPPMAAPPRRWQRHRVAPRREAQRCMEIARKLFLAAATLICFKSQNYDVSRSENKLCAHVTTE